MKKLLLTLTTPFLLSSYSFASNLPSEDCIREKPGAHHTYNKTFDAGLYDIMMAARTDRKEDAWLFNGKKWCDVCIDSDGYSVMIFPLTVKYIRESSAKDDDVLIHNHLQNMDFPAYDFSLSYMPPSPNDFNSYIGRKESSLEDLTEGVVDSKGLWLYDVDSDKVNSQTINKYFILVDNFLQAQGSKDFDFDSEYETLKKQSEYLGIYLNFYHVEEPLDFLKEKSFLSTDQ